MARRIMLSKEDAGVALAAFEREFFASLADMERYMRDGVKGSTRPAEFATSYLISRSITDLQAGMEQGRLGRLVQMSSLVRPVIESLNLIEWFGRDPANAEMWTNGEHKKFRPAAVRAAIGSGYDAVYDFFCERSHPRFAGAQLNTYGVTDGRGVMLIGGLPINDPQVLIGVSMLADLATDLAYTLSHVRVADDYANEKLIPTVRRVAERGVSATQAILSALFPDGVPDGSIGADILATVKAHADGLVELEAQVRAELDQRT